MKTNQLTPGKKFTRKYVFLIVMQVIAIIGLIITCVLSLTNFISFTNYLLASIIILAIYVLISDSKLLMIGRIFCEQSKELDETMNQAEKLAKELDKLLSEKL